MKKNRRKFTKILFASIFSMYLPVILRDKILKIIVKKIKKQNLDFIN